MASNQLNRHYVQFKSPLPIPLFDELYDSEGVDRRIWTTHKNVSIEWIVRFSMNATDSDLIDFQLKYVDGPSAEIRFFCTMRGFRSASMGENHLDSGSLPLSLKRGETFLTKKVVSFEVITYEMLYHELHLKVAADSFELDNPCKQYSDGQDWLIDFYKHIENEDSKLSDIRLISGDDHTFYCHRFVLVAQSDALEAMFRNAQTEEEKNGTFRLSAWSTNELRRILEYFYASKPNLESLAIDHLMNIFHFAEQYGLERLKEYVAVGLWKRAPLYPTSCTEMARFADLHDLKPLKYRCFDVLAENLLQLKLKVDDMFEEKPQDAPDIDGEPAAKKMRGSNDEDTKQRKGEIGIRLKNELVEYLAGRIVGFIV